MFTHYIDENISLRMFQERDAQEFFELTMHSKEYLREWLGWLDFVNTVEDTAHHIKTTLEAFAENGGYPTIFAILYKGKIAGTIGFNSIYAMHKSGSIGYWLGQEYQGKGIMSKAFAAMLAYGFRDLQLNRIEVRAAAGNKKSRTIPEKFGFTMEGQIRQAEWLYDHFVDHIVYGLLIEEWQKQQRGSAD